MSGCQTQGLTVSLPERGNMMTREILCWLILGFCLSAQAQAAGPEALLQRAHETHGGDALRTLNTYQDEGTLTYFDSTGNPVNTLSYKTYLDLARGRVRFEGYQDGQLAFVQQLLPKAVRLWLPQNGVTLLSATEGGEDLRRSLFQSVFNLREGAAGFDRVADKGRQTWNDVTGRAVEVVRSGFVATLLLAEDGTLLGERYMSAAVGETTVLYRDYRVVNEIKFPDAADVYVSGMPVRVGNQAVSNVRVNEDLTTAFTPLERLETADLTITPEALTWIREHAIPFRTVEAGGSFDDLTPLKKTVGNARIVALGEQTHGTREFFKMKHRLLEFLVSEMGYSIFAIEANMPEAYRLNEYVLTGKGDPAALLEGMYFWTWDTQEVLDMIEWMRAYNASGRGPVQFTGFDMQFPNVAAGNVRNFLKEVDPDYWQEIKNLYARVGQLDTDTTSKTSVQLIKPLEEVVTRLKTNAPRYRKTVPAGEVSWAVQNARIVAQAMGVMTGGTSYRDRAMAENIGWISEQNPDAKVVLWAHNGHVQQGEGWMGHHLSERYGDDYLAVGFSMNQGVYTAVRPGEGVTADNRAGAASEKTVDGFLNAVELPRFILDVRQVANSPAATWLAEERLFRSIGAVAMEDTSAFAPTVIDRDYDLLVFIAETTASTPLR